MTDYEIKTMKAGDYFTTDFSAFATHPPKVSPHAPVWTKTIPTAPVKLSFEMGRSYTAGEELEPLKSPTGGDLPLLFGYSYMKLSNFFEQVPASWPRQIIDNVYQVTQQFPKLIQSGEIDFIEQLLPVRDYSKRTNSTIQDSYTSLLKTRYDAVPVEYMKLFPAVDIEALYNEFYPSGITGNNGVKQPIVNDHIPHSKELDFSGSIQSLNLECGQCELPTVGNCVYIGLELPTTHRIDAYGTTAGNYYISTDSLPSIIAGQVSNHWTKVKIVCGTCYTQMTILTEQFQYLKHMENAAIAVSKTDRYKSTLGNYQNSGEWLQRGQHGNGCIHMTSTSGFAKEIPSLTSYAPHDIPCPIVWDLVAGWTENVLNVALEQFAGIAVTADALLDHMHDAIWQTIDSQYGQPMAFDAVLYHASESRTNDAHLTARDYYPTTELTRTQAEIDRYGQTPKEILRMLTETIGSVIARDLVYDQLGHVLDLLQQSEPIKV